MKKINDFLDAIQKASRRIGNSNNEKYRRNIILIDNDSLLLISNQKYLVAKVLQKKYNATVYVISNRNTEYREQMIKAYGFKFINLSKYSFFFHIIAICKSAWFCLFHRIDNLLDLKLCNIYCGDLCYDSIIARSDHVYTLSTLWSKKAIRELALMYYTFFCIDKIFKEIKPVTVISQDLVYRDGLFSRYAYQHGCDVVVLTSGRPSIVVRPNEYLEINYRDIHEKRIRYALETLAASWEKEANNELNRLFQGDWDWNASNAYNDKIVVERDCILNDLGINNGKKNIIIMAHCFSDTPNGNGCNGLYKDYYIWLKRTIEIANTVEDVNWILKPHPSRSQYDEDGYVEKLCESKSHIHLMPDKYSAVMVGKIADCIVTVNGTAGLEMPCMGVPCINAGHPFYTSFGFSICPNTIEEYELLLKEIGKIEKLNEDQIKVAKKILFLDHKISRIHNDFSDRCYDIHQKFCVDKRDDEANEKYIDLFCEYVENNKMDQMYDYVFANSI